MTTTEITLNYEFLEAQLSNYINQCIALKGITHCHDDVEELRQVSRIKLFEITPVLQSKYEAGDFKKDNGLSETQNLLAYAKKSVKHAIIDRGAALAIVKTPRSRWVDVFEVGASVEQQCEETTCDTEQEMVDNYCYNNAISKLTTITKFVDPEKLGLIYDLYLRDMSPNELAEDIAARNKKNTLSARAIQRRAKAGLEDLKALCNEIDINSSDVL
ncbi:hypothetical protein VTH8203_00864 [Vibrio thalassae]|uniref:Uncharacterized protein n=1 Tax=Vibrio thalassae TaxID=1243014 RepID=A0A240EG62_9VIBR|nr:hypothetical protein [Vibrio thalassae]SNX47263.1 hypothetical protein VTH8203_00864 [Vibrio thalassae]